MPRHDFSRKVKALAYERAQGCCEACGTPLMGRRAEYDHVLADWLGGESTLANCACLCPKCHRQKTTGDQNKISKSKRVRDKNTGAWKTHRPIMGSKASGWKRKFDGTVVKR